MCSRGLSTALPKGLAAETTVLSLQLRQPGAPRPLGQEQKCEPSVSSAQGASTRHAELLL